MQFKRKNIWNILVKFKYMLMVIKIKTKKNGKLFVFNFQKKIINRPKNLSCPQFLGCIEEGVRCP